MTISLTPQNIIIDETTGFQDVDVDATAAPHITNTTLQYLLSLDSPGGLASREVAFEANFVVASASAGETITSVVLAQNLGGTPFSTTVGVNSGIRTVDGNYVWLFQDATHANVVIGVIGTSDLLAEPAESGPLAFSFALINTNNTNAKAVSFMSVSSWIASYCPLNKLVRSKKGEADSPSVASDRSCSRPSPVSSADRTSALTPQPA